MTIIRAFLLFPPPLQGLFGLQVRYNRLKISTPTVTVGIQVSFYSLFSINMEVISVAIACGLCWWNAELYSSHTPATPFLQQCVLGLMECVFIGNYGTFICLQGSKGHQGLLGLPGTRGLPVSYYMNWISSTSAAHIVSHVKESVKSYMRYIVSCIHYKSQGKDFSISIWQ